MSSMEFATYCMEMLEPVGGISMKRMFGGFGFYRGGYMFALIADDVLYFKVGAETQPDFEAGGSQPFTYIGKHRPVQLSYWTVPDDVMDDEAALQQWAVKASDEAAKAKAV